MGKKGKKSSIYFIRELKVNNNNNTIIHLAMIQMHIYIYIYEYFLFSISDKITQCWQYTLNCVHPQYTLSLPSLFKRIPSEGSHPGLGPSLSLHNLCVLFALSRQRKRSWKISRAPRSLSGLFGATRQKIALSASQTRENELWRQ